MVQSADRFPALNEYDEEGYDDVEELENLYERAKEELSGIADEMDEHIDRVREAKDILRQSSELEDLNHPDFFADIDDGVTGMKNIKKLYEELGDDHFPDDTSTKELDPIMFEMHAYAKRFERLESEIRFSSNNSTISNELQSGLTEASDESISIDELSEVDEISEEQEKALRYAIFIDGDKNNIGESLTSKEANSPQRVEGNSEDDPSIEDLADSLGKDTTD